MSCDPWDFRQDRQPPPIPAPASEPRQCSTALFRANSLRNAAEAASGVEDAQKKTLATSSSSCVRKFQRPETRSARNESRFGSSKASTRKHPQRWNVYVSALRQY